MKICFLFLDNFNRAPYLKRYISLIENVDFDIIFWNRRSILEEYGQKNSYDLRYKISNKNNILSKVKKLIAYLLFSYKANYILKNTHYDKIVVFGVNTAFLVKKILLSKYPHNFILDIRDYWNEHNKMLLKIEKKIILKSGLCLISSVDYQKFLPKHNYCIIHNSQLIDTKQVRTTKNNNQRIILACIGGSKYIEYDKKIILSFKNDNRFLLKYIGRGYELLNSFCSNNGVENVVIGGEFPIEKTFDYYEDVDMILNLYGSGTPKLDHALSNKLYISTQLKLPIIVNQGTFMSEIVHEFNLGISVNIENADFRDRIHNYYTDLDFEIFSINCDSFNQKVAEEDNFANSMIRKFITNIEEDVKI
ncbi:MAG: hypothetical protein RBQ91_04430 [Acholeplasma sp.]|nr:hypothetical protein [Acholeplasma sp.]